MESALSLFKNRLSFEYIGIGDWLMNGDYWVKDHFGSNSKIFSLSSLNINNINDLMEEATPSIYYMLSWLEDHFKNKECVYMPYDDVEGVSLFFIPEDIINFSTTLYFYDEIKEFKPRFNLEDLPPHLHGEIIEAKPQFILGDYVGFK